MTLFALGKKCGDPNGIFCSSKICEIIFCDGYKYIMSLKEDVFVTGKADEEFINDVSLKIKWYLNTTYNMIEISKGVYIVDLKKFTDIYNARKDLLPILSDGVNERMELYLNKKDTIKENW